MPKPKIQLMTVGDVLKTHPCDGYWGCAIVLKTREKTKDSLPMCHIGLTPIIFQRDYAWDEIERRALTILEYDRGIYIGQGACGQRRETCIGIYTRRPNPAHPVIANIDIAGIFDGPLGWQPGNGTAGKWPHCGHVEGRFGIEAVQAWRAIHDRKRWLAEMKASMEAHDELHS